MTNIKEKFIISKKLELQTIEAYAERLLPFCTVYSDGEIALGNEKLTTLEKVKVALTARYLANGLDNTISAEITPEELVHWLNIPKDQISARLKDTRDAHFASTSEKGSTAYSQKIGDFLTELEHKYGEKKI